MTVHDVRSFGARGDGVSDDTRAIQAAIDECGKTGGRVLLGANSAFRAGSLFLRSHVELHVEAGTTLTALEQESDFPGPIPGKYWIQAWDAEDVAVSGGGTLDGNGRAFMSEFRRYRHAGVRIRPKLLAFFGCRRVRLSNVQLKDSADWAVHPCGCRDVLIDGLTIRNDLAIPNCDGIDPDHCRDVRIRNCDIEAGDDGIVIKNRAEWARYGATENIVVTGCRITSTSCALKIGTETVDDFRNIIFSNCVVRASNRGLGIVVRDAGNVENVLFSDITVETRMFEEGWWGKAEPIYVTSLRRDPNTLVGKIRNVRFHNIICRSEAGVYVHGCDTSMPDNIIFSNVDITVSKRSKWPGGIQDPRPCMMRDVYGAPVDGPGNPWGDLVPHPTTGMFLCKADRVVLRNTHVRWGEPMLEEHGELLEVHDVSQLEGAEMLETIDAG